MCERVSVCVCALDKASSSLTTNTHTHSHIPSSCHDEVRATQIRQVMHRLQRLKTKTKQKPIPDMIHYLVESIQECSMCCVSGRILFQEGEIQQQQKDLFSLS